MNRNFRDKHKFLIKKVYVLQDEESKLNCYTLFFTKVPIYTTIHPGVDYLSDTAIYRSC
jgi:hypothetical protein